MATASVSDVEDRDERGFLEAGDNHRFDPKSPDRRAGKGRRRGWTFGGRRKRHLRTLSMPVAPADLDLDKTLKAEESFLSPVASGDESGVSGSASNSHSGSASRRKKNHSVLSRDDSESESVSSVVSQLAVDVHAVVKIMSVWVESFTVGRISSGAYYKVGSSSTRVVITTLFSASRLGLLTMLGVSG